MLSEEAPRHPRDPYHPHQQAEASPEHGPVEMLSWEALDVEVLDETRDAVDVAAAEAMREWDLQEDVEDGVGERRVEQEEEDDDSRDGAVGCLPGVTSDVEKPEEEGEGDAQERQQQEEQEVDEDALHSFLA